MIDPEAQAYIAERAWTRLTEEQERIEALADLTERTWGQPRHNWGNRDVWRYIDPSDPWSELVNREGFTPGGVQLFRKDEAA